MKYVVLTLKDSGLQKWQASVAVDEESEVYIPAFAFSATESTAILFAVYDGVPTIWEFGHMYFPISWAIKNANLFAREGDNGQFIAELKKLRDNVLRANDEAP